MCCASPADRVILLRASAPPHTLVFRCLPSFILIQRRRVQGRGSDLKLIIHASSPYGPNFDFYCLPEGRGYETSLLNLGEVSWPQVKSGSCFPDFKSSRILNSHCSNEGVLPIASVPFRLCRGHSFESRFVLIFQSVMKLYSFYVDSSVLEGGNCFSCLTISAH